MVPQGFLVQLPASDDPPAHPTRIIFDPIWSLRASPVSIAGPKRRLPPPCKLNQLPEFHFVVISHNQSAYPTTSLFMKVINHLFQLRSLGLADYQGYSRGRGTSGSVLGPSWEQTVVCGRRNRGREDT